MNEFLDDGRSEQLNELFAALAKAQAEMPMANLSANNPFFKSKYADLPELVRASRPVLSKYGLSIVQRDWLTANGALSLRTILGHSSGQWIESRMILQPAKSDVQSLMSYRSYCRRYAYASICGVVADEFDDDGNTAAHTGYPREANKSDQPITKEQYDALIAEITTGNVANLVKEAFNMQQLTGFRNIFQAEYGTVIREIRRIKEEQKNS